MYKIAPVALLATVIAVIIGFTNLSAARAAEAELCNALPDVAWWVKAPKKIKNLVASRYKGDWDRYIASWQRYHDSMEQSLEIGEARVIKSRGISLQGPSLAVFVFNIKKRIEVLACYSRKAQTAENLEGFATAAGGPTAKMPGASPAGAATRNAMALNRCDRLPQADWWSKTPAAVRVAVASKYDGDWDRYIARWRDHYRSMKRSLEKNKPRIVRSIGLTLAGKTLEDHVGKIERRVEVLVCLQKNAEAIEARAASQKAGDAVASFETASGGPATEVIRINEMEIIVEAQCVEGEARFNLTNLGARWPRLGEITIYRLDTEALLVKRRLRMKNSQQISYRIPPKRQRGASGVGFFVKPSWYNRPFKFDATIACTG